jgi:hypothetical protein
MAAARRRLQGEAQRFAQFHRRAPDRVTQIDLPPIRALVYLGKAVAIEYESDKRAFRRDYRIPKSRRYRHVFSRPVTLYTEKSGRVLIVLGGKLKVTDWLRN